MSINNNTLQRRVLMKYVRREPRGGIGVVFLIFRVSQNVIQKIYGYRGKNVLDN
jgi:hypothetical protein